MPIPRHREGMAWFIALLFLVAVGPLAVLYGVDSRFDDRRR